MKAMHSDETRVGDVLLRMGTITQTQLTDAVKQQRTGDTRPLGILLMELGYADAHSVQLALLRQQALRGQLSHDDGLRLLDEAREQTEKMGGSLSELTEAVEKMGGPRDD